MENKYKQLLNDTVILALGNVLVKVIQFFLLPIYTLSLTTAEYATAELYNCSIEIVLPILTLSFSDAVLRFTMEKRTDSKEILNTGMIICLIGSIICFFGSYIASKFIPSMPFLLFCFLFLANSLKTTFAQYARAIDRIRLFALSNVFFSLLLIVFSIVFLVYLRFGVDGYILSFLLSNFFVFLILLFSLKKDVKTNFHLVSFGEFKEMVSYSLPLVPNTISWWLTNTANRYIVLFVCGANIGGLFSAASKLPALMNVCTNTFQQAWIISAIKQKNSSSNEFQQTVFKYFNEFMFVVAAFVIVSTPIISVFLLQGTFYEAWKFVPLLIVSAVLGGWSSFFGTFYAVEMKNKMSMISTLVGGCVNVILCYFLSSLFGVFGALWASLFAYTTITIIRIVSTRKWCKISISKFSIVSFILLILLSLTIIMDAIEWHIISGVTFILIMIINRNILNVLKIIKLRRKQLDRAGV